MADEQTL